MILGTAQLGMDYGVANEDGAPSKEQAFAMLDRAHVGGIRVLDTAEGYGRSEKIIGDYLKMHPASFRVCTKLPAQIEVSGSIERTTYQHAIERTEKLCVDAVECLYLHRFSQCCSKRILNGLQMAKEDGLAKAIGVSIYHPTELDYISGSLAKQIDVVQIPLNVLSYRKWKPCMERAVEAGLMLLARSVFLQGLLLMELEAQSVSRLGATEYIAEIERAAVSVGMSRRDYCYRVIRALPQIEDVMVGCDNERQLQENLELESVSLSAEKAELFLHDLYFGTLQPPVTVTNPSLWREDVPRKKICCILQARMGSSRLPGKVLEELNGKPLIDNIIDRITSSNYLDCVIVATTDGEEDDLLATHCRSKGIDVFRGSSEDVLDRYFSCAREYGADIIVRLTSDNPFIDAAHVDRAIELFTKDEGLDYLVFHEKLPLGLQVEVFSIDALAKAWDQSTDAECREHVTPYIFENPELFSCCVVPGYGEVDYSDTRLTVDTWDDLNTARALYAKLPNGFDYEDLVSLVSSHSELLTNTAVRQKQVSYSGQNNTRATH